MERCQVTACLRFTWGKQTEAELVSLSGLSVHRCGTVEGELVSCCPTSSPGLGKKLFDAKCKKFLGSVACCCELFVGR